MPGDPTPVERRKFPRHVARLSLRLEAENAPGGVAVEEKTIAEDVSLWGAQVRATSLRSGRAPSSRSRRSAATSGPAPRCATSRSAPDGQPRLNLLFLDASAPERLLPAVGASEKAQG